MWENTLKVPLKEVKDVLISLTIIPNECSVMVINRDSCSLFTLQSESISEVFSCDINGHKSNPQPITAVDDNLEFISIIGIYGDNAYLHATFGTSRHCIVLMSTKPSPSQQMRRFFCWPLATLGLLEDPCGWLLLDKRERYPSLLIVYGKKQCYSRSSVMGTIEPFQVFLSHSSVLSMRELDRGGPLVVLVTESDEVFICNPYTRSILWCLDLSILGVYDIIPYSIRSEFLSSLTTSLAPPIASPEEHKRLVGRIVMCDSDQSQSSNKKPRGITNCNTFPIMLRTATAMTPGVHQYSRTDRELCIRSNDAATEPSEPSIAKAPDCVSGLINSDVRLLSHVATISLTDTERESTRDSHSLKPTIQWGSLLLRMHSKHPDAKQMSHHKASPQLFFAAQKSHSVDCMSVSRTSLRSIHTLYNINMKRPISWIGSCSVVTILYEDEKETCTSSSVLSIKIFPHLAATVGYDGCAREAGEASIEIPLPKDLYMDHTWNCSYIDGVTVKSNAYVKDDMRGSNQTMRMVLAARQEDQAVLLLGRMRKKESNEQRDNYLE